jgi:hypothetical protein
MNLEIKHLAPYLPYMLKCKIKNGEEILIDTLQAIYNSSIRPECTFYNIIESQQGFDFVKPILRPLSDLSKEIEVNGEKFVPIKKLLNQVGFNYPIECYNQDMEWVLNDGYRALGEMPHRKVQLLFECHFDVFGLIENDLAIDINTLK